MSEISSKYLIPRQRNIDPSLSSYLCHTESFQECRKQSSIRNLIGRKHRAYTVLKWKIQLRVEKFNHNSPRRTHTHLILSKINLDSMPIILSLCFLSSSPLFFPSFLSLCTRYSIIESHDSLEIADSEHLRSGAIHRVCYRKRCKGCKHVFHRKGVKANEDKRSERHE